MDNVNGQIVETEGLQAAPMAPSPNNGSDLSLEELASQAFTPDQMLEFALLQ